MKIVRQIGAVLLALALVITTSMLAVALGVATYIFKIFFRAFKS